MARRCVAAYPYEPANPGDLGLVEGDRLEVIPPTPELITQWGPFGGGDGWALGRNFATGAEGIFPEAYVLYLPPEAAEPAPALAPAAPAAPAVDMAGAAAALSGAPAVSPGSDAAKPKKRMSLKAAANAAKAAKKAGKMAGGMASMAAKLPGGGDAGAAGGGNRTAEEMAGMSTDPNGMEVLVGEDEQSCLARQRRLQDEAKARMAAKFGGAGVGAAGSVSSTGGEGACAKCRNGCFQYGPQHPQFPTVNHIPDWSCDVCSTEFTNPSQSLQGYENLFACGTFETCDWIACGACLRAPPGNPAAAAAAAPALIVAPVLADPGGGSDAEKRHAVDVLYGKFNPEKLSDVDQLIGKYGAEVLLKMIQKKYAPYMRGYRCTECDPRKHLIEYNSAHPCYKELGDIHLGEWDCDVNTQTSFPAQFDFQEYL